MAFPLLLPGLAFVPFIFYPISEINRSRSFAFLWLSCLGILEFEHPMESSRGLDENASAPQTF